MDVTSNLWQVALSLGAVVGLVMVLGYLAKRTRLGNPQASGAIDVIDNKYLGPKERLLLVRVADQHVLVGMSANGMSALGPFEDTPEFEHLLAQSKRTQATPHEASQHA